MTLLILLVFQVEDVLRLQPVGAGGAGPELVARVGERVGEGHGAAALCLGRAVGQRGLADERGDVAGLLGGVGAAVAAAQEEPLVTQLALAAQGALKNKRPTTFGQKKTVFLRDILKYHSALNACNKQTGMEVIERLCFLASLCPPSTGKRIISPRAQRGG